MTGSAGTTMDVEGHEQMGKGFWGKGMPGPGFAAVLADEGKRF